MMWSSFIRKEGRIAGMIGKCESLTTRLRDLDVDYVAWNHSCLVDLQP